MNKKVLRTLEYDRIKQNLYTFATTAMGKKMIDKLQPSSNMQKVSKILTETEDGAKILRIKGGIPIPSLISIKSFLKRLDIGGTLNSKELAAIGKVLRATNEVDKFFGDLTNNKVELKILYEEIKKLESLPKIGHRLLISIENDGYVTDDASTLLKSIRQQISVTENTIRERLNTYIRGVNSKYLSNAVVTIRNERYVIPVKQEYRGKFGGIVHDQSSSGQTLFIEPAAILELNNRLRQQQVTEREEIRRILEELSQELAPYTHELDENAKILGKLDFINAKAKYAHSIKATNPILSENNDVYLRQAWHPLIEKDKVVCNDISIGKDYQAIVITGPNTGGKTITLKTLGLIQLMGQSGLYIPANEESRIGIFGDIFADIGDEQSIEQSLSTFSSHMTNIVDILNKIDDKSLVLFDELGAGTDPQEGAALAISILDAIGAKGSYVVATTHYPELKAYGFERPQTINASMEFNVDTLQPTYRLLIGIPGRSNAFDISQRLGLDRNIVEAARQITSEDSQDLNEMISDLVAKRHDAEEKEIAYRRYLREAEELHNDLEKNFHQFEQQKENMLEQAKQKANEIVDETKQKTDELISELRKMRLSAGKNIKEGELIAVQGELNSMHHTTNLKKNKVLRKAKIQQELHPNDDVMVISYGQRGVLLRKASNHAWEVQIGILKMKINEDDIEKITVKEKKGKRVGTSLKSSSPSHVAPNLDLRGERYESAMVKVDRYIDAAVLAGYNSVTIIHGKGTGALRNGIIKYLKQNKVVKSFEFASQSNGGNGATVVYFK